MDLTMGGIILQAMSILQDRGGAKVQAQMADDLKLMREILQRQFGVSDPAYLLTPKELWTDSYPVLPKSTIIIVTGAHVYSEMFDRSVAYALKLAIDRMRWPAVSAPTSLVTSDIWIGREPELVVSRVVISVGGPKVNTFTADLIRNGTLVHSEVSWQVYAKENHYAVFGNEATDTLLASQYFMKHVLHKLLQL